MQNPAPQTARKTSKNRTNPGIVDLKGQSLPNKLEGRVSPRPRPRDPSRILSVNAKTKQTGGTSFTSSETTGPSWKLSANIKTKQTGGTSFTSSETTGPSWKLSVKPKSPPVNPPSIQKPAPPITRKKSKSRGSHLTLLNE